MNALTIETNEVIRQLEGCGDDHCHFPLSGRNFFSQFYKSGEMK